MKVELLEQYLTNWLQNHDYELEVKVCENEFFYSDPLSLIAVSPNATNLDHYFLDFISLNDCSLTFSNAFIPMFLHEVGHSETMDDFSEEEWEEYRDFEHSFSNLDMDNPFLQFRYFSHPIEFAATSWAISFINTHQQEIEEMVKALGEIFHS